DRLLTNMPANGRQFYETLYGRKARALLDQVALAVEARTGECKGLSPAEIYKLVASRYLHTDAGREALYRLADRCLRDGDNALAARCYERLLARLESAGEADKITPQLLIKVCLAYSRAADPDRAEKSWARLAKLAPEGVKLRERQVALD